MISLILFLSNSKLSSLLNRSNVLIENFDKLNTSPPSINFKNRFAISLDPFELMSLEGKRYFDFAFVIGKYEIFPNGTELKTKRYLNVSKCKITDFPMFSEEEFKRLGMYNWLCPNYTNKDDFEIKGKFGDSIFQYLQFNVKECKNSSNSNANNYCALDDEISEIRKNKSGKIYFNIKLINNLQNLNNFENPFSSFIDPIEYLISNKDSFIQREFYFSKIDIQTDDSRSFNFLRNEKFFIKNSTFIYERKFDEYKLNENNYSGNDKIYSTIILRSDQKSIVINRSYVNFQDCLQTFGSLYTVFFVIFKLICQFFTKDKFTEKIANSLYNFSNIEISGGLSFRKLLKKAKNQNEETKYKNSFFIRVKEFFFRRRESLQNKSMNQSKQLNFTLNEINKTIGKDLDLIQILQRQKQFENLKNIFFNKDQRILFEFAAKPKFTIDSTNAFKKEIVKNFKHISVKSSRCSLNNPNYLNTHYKLNQAYKNILKSPNEEINKKILEILDFSFLNKLSILSNNRKKKKMINFDDCLTVVKISN